MSKQVGYQAMPKQAYFNDLCLTGSKCFILYGGAMRGGKTFNLLMLFFSLAMWYPLSRWFMCRRTLQNLKNTAIPLSKTIKEYQENAVYNEQSNEWVFPNGSVVKFFATNEEKDRQLLRINGLEANGIAIEEMDVSYAEYCALQNRVGSWQRAVHNYNLVTGIYGAPPSFFCGTTNPQIGWVKEKIYDPWKAGVSSEHFIYIPALLTENIHLDPNYHDGLKKRLSPREYQAKVLGDWDALGKAEGALFHAFSDEIHVGKTQINHDLPLIISFDNNVLPYIAISVWQIDRENKEILQVGEIAAKSPNNSVQRAGVLISDFLKKNNWDREILFYGDASTSQKNTIDQEKRSFADLLFKTVRQNGFSVQNKMLKSNPSVALSSEFVNGLYEGFDGWSITIDESCRESITDYLNVKADEDGGTLKEKAKSPSGAVYEKFGHFSDTKRYVLYGSMPNEYRRYLNRFSNNFDLSNNINIFDDNFTY